MPSSARLRQLVKKRQEDAPRTGAKIEQAKRLFPPARLLDEGERRLDQRLGIGPWVERALIDEKAPPVELARAGDARDGLAGRAAVHQSFEPCRRLWLKRLARPRHEALVGERRGMT